MNERAPRDATNAESSQGPHVGPFTTLLDAAHQQLGAPIVLVWVDLGGHTSAAMRALVAARPRLRVYTMPAYAPELNPVEKVWSHLERSLATLRRHR